jgi:hypothetical protein
MNEAVAEIIKRYPDRFIGFAGFDPNTGEESLREIEYAVKTLGFLGIKSVPSALELDLNDKAFYPFYSKAEELGIPVLIHVGSVILKGLRTKHVHPLMVDDIAFDFPGLKIICAHLGGWQYMDTISMMLHHRNVYADISFWPLNPLFKELVDLALLLKAPLAVIDHKGPLETLFLRDNPRRLSNSGLGDRSDHSSPVRSSAPDRSNWPLYNRSPRIHAQGLRTFLTRPPHDDKSPANPVKSFEPSILKDERLNGEP